MRVALERNVVKESDLHYSNVSRSHHQPAPFILRITCTQIVKTLVKHCPFQVYSHLNDDNTKSNVSPGFQSLADHIIIINI